MTPTPYAIFANGASNLLGVLPAVQLSGAIPSASLTGTFANPVNLDNSGNSFTGNGSGLTSLNASALTTGTVPDAQLAADVALTDANQTFTATNIFETGTNNGRFLLQGNAGIDTSLFTGLGLQFVSGSGEGAIMSSFNDGYGFLSFYTKQGNGFPVAKQVVIDRYGGVAIDQQGVNSGVLNDGTTNGVGLSFGKSSGEGIASQRTDGINKNGLDFYTSHQHRLSILNNGDVGINNTNPAFQLDVAGTINATNFTGSGAGLTNLTATQLTGIVPLADLPAVLGLITDPGSANFFAGQSTGNSGVTGYYDVAVGLGALAAIGSGSYNSAFGSGAMEFDTSGSYNTANGFDALSAITVPYFVVGSGNTADGAYALADDEGGSNNVAVGYQALSSATADNGAVAVGYQALQMNTASGGFLSIGSGNVAVGYQAMQQNTSGSDNTAIGWQALNKNTNGYDNSAMGTWALLLNTSGYNNTANGAYALLDNTSGYQNTANGEGALGANTTGYDNVAIGANALQSATIDDGIVAIGYGALQNDVTSGGFITIGSGNEAVGYEALQLDNSGFWNTAIGCQSLALNTGGYENTALGTLSLNALTGGNNNVAVGFAAGSAYTASESGNIDIGNSGLAGENNTTHLGSSQTDTYVAGTIHGNAALNIDQSSTYGQNSGSVRANALTFGTGPDGSGEGIASQRTSGPNQFDLVLFTGFNPRLTVLSGGNVGIGLTNPAALLEVGGNALVDNNLSTATLTIRGGSDLAEPFKFSGPENATPEGAVVVIDESNPGRLKLSDQAYDTRVAGVVSGANGIHPGIQMHQEGMLEGGKNVALSGRVYVQADATNGPIKPGDLLTTSSTPGCAMKVTDHLRAQGAILGKAMTGLSEGKGMVLVLVTLQ